MVYGPTTPGRSPYGTSTPPPILMKHCSLTLRMCPSHTMNKPTWGHLGKQISAYNIRAYVQVVYTIEELMRTLHKPCTSCLQMLSWGAYGNKLKTA